MNASTTFLDRVRQMMQGTAQLPARQDAQAARLLRSGAQGLALFCNRAPWLLDGSVQTLQLPASIAGELARLVTAELAGSVTGSARADYLNEQLAPVLCALRTQCEYALAGGGLALKPYVEGARIAVEFVGADRFLPTAWNGCGEVTSAVFLERVEQADGVYTRLESHRLTPEGYFVENKAYRSHSGQGLGTPAPLSSVAAWAQLSATQCIRCADGSAPAHPLFAYFKMPFANQQEPGSPLGVPVYSRAEGLLEQADRHYTRILWEYEGSELAVDASAGAVQLEQGEARLPRAKQRLFRELALDKGDGGDLYSVFSPAIRDESLFHGLNELLKRIEFACYLSYGTLSDPQSVEKTAEEIKMSRQRSYSAVCDVQKSLAAALEQLVRAMDAYATLYALAPQGAYETAFAFGDAICTDTAAERAAMRQDCLDGAAQWWEYRVKFYGENEATARARVAERSVDAKST